MQIEAEHSKLRHLTGMVMYPTGSATEYALAENLAVLAEIEFEGGRAETNDVTVETGKTLLFLFDWDEICCANPGMAFLERFDKKKLTEILKDPAQLFEDDHRTPKASLRGHSMKEHRVSLGHDHFLKHLIKKLVHCTLHPKDVRLKLDKKRAASVDARYLTAMGIESYGRSYFVSTALFAFARQLFSASHVVCSTTTSSSWI